MLANILFDYALIVSYVVLLSCLVLNVGDASASAVNAASLFVIAGIFDGIEGIGLLLMNYDPRNFNPYFPMITTGFALAKVGLLLSGGSYGIQQWLAKKKPDNKKQ